MTQQIPERLSGGGIDLSTLARNAGQAPGQQGAAPSGVPAAPGHTATAAGEHSGVNEIEVSSLVFDVTDHSFEQTVQLSQVVPVVIDLWAEWCQPCKTLGPVLEKLTLEFAGRLLLGKVDVDANPGLAQAFQAQSIPTVVALIAGRAVPLFQGAIPEQQVREVFSQLVQLGQQQGLTGSVRTSTTTEDSPENAAPSEPPVNPAHEAALAAIERGDYAAAIREYEQVLTKTPADRQARAALMQTRLLARLQGADAASVRQAAAAQPHDIDAGLQVADLDLSGGHAEDAFSRLLTLFAEHRDEADRSRIRARLLELFEVVGQSDPRVAEARAQLANLLY